MLKLGFNYSPLLSSVFGSTFLLFFNICIYAGMGFGQIHSPERKLFWRVCICYLNFNVSNADWLLRELSSRNVALREVWYISLNSRGWRGARE